MKNFILTSIMVLAFYLGISNTKSIMGQIDYVVTDRGIFTADDAKAALNGQFYLDSNGKTFQLKLSDIESVIINGKEYTIK
jgi:hypothetical protein